MKSYQATCTARLQLIHRI